MQNARNAALIKRILGPDLLSLTVVHYTVSEYVGPDAGCNVTVTLAHADDPEQRAAISGRGVGVVDAIFHGLMGHFSKAFDSLGTISFTGFRVQGCMATSTDAQGLDAEAEVTIKVVNAHHRPAEFTARGRSTLAAALSAVVQVVEHFINAERAYLRIHTALVDARRRSRPDLVDRFTAELAALVDNTSYESVAPAPQQAG